MISVTKPWGEHTIQDQLHGVASFTFQSGKDEIAGDEGELCSHVNRRKASWFATANTGAVRRPRKKKGRKRGGGEGESDEKLL